MRMPKIIRQWLSQPKPSEPELEAPVVLEEETHLGYIVGDPDMLDELIAQGMTRSPIQVAGGELGPGLRAFMMLPDTGWNGPVCLFVENYFPARPRDPGMGWSSEEIIHYEGAITPHRTSPMRIEEGIPRAIYMESINLEEFIARYIRTERARLVLERAMEHLRSQAVISDDYLREIVSVWHSRSTSVDAVGPRWMN